MWSHANLWNNKIKKQRQSETCIVINEKSRGSVATHLRCDWMFNGHFIADLLTNLTAKMFWKSISGQKYCVLFFCDSRCIYTTVVSGVVVGVCNCSQMSKYTCLIFGVSIGLDPGYKRTEGIFDRSKFKVTRDISPTISGRLLVSQK